MIQPKKIMQQRFLERQSGQQGWLRKKTRCVWIMWGDCTLPETNIAPEKWMVGRVLSFWIWEGLFSGAMLVLGRVNLFLSFFNWNCFLLPSRSLTKIAPEKLPKHKRKPDCLEESHIFLQGCSLAVKLQGCMIHYGELYSKNQGVGRVGCAAPKSLEPSILEEMKEHMQIRK